MTIEYQLDEQDFLDYQMYGATKSEVIKRKRLQKRLLMPIAYLALAGIFFFREDISIGITFAAIAIIWYAARPALDKRRFERHYTRYIKEQYKDDLNKTTTLYLNEEHIIAKDGGRESKIPLTELAEVIELTNIIILKLKAGQAILLPKKTIANTTELIVLLKERSNRLNINYTDDTNWVWK